MQNLQPGKLIAVITLLTVYENWKRSGKRFFATVRRIQKANKNADLDEVMHAVLEAQQAVRANIAQERPLSSKLRRCV